MSRNPCPFCLSRVPTEDGRCAMENVCLPRFSRTLGQKCTKKRRRGKSQEEISAFADNLKAEFNARLGEQGEFHPKLSMGYFPFVGGACDDNQD